MKNTQGANRSAVLSNGPGFGSDGPLGRVLTGNQREAQDQEQPNDVEPGREFTEVFSWGNDKCG